jgi:glycosyltransferase involved in cell wall biosynthesis
VIVPVHNGGEWLALCLDSVVRSDLKNFELIVIDDASTDRSAELAEAYGSKVVRLAVNSGPARARNVGAEHSRAPILFFLDSDVLIEPDTLGRIVRTFEEEPSVDAVFGSYGRETVPDNFVSRYKNLLHHYTHQTSDPDAVTFCGGFGAIKREVFSCVNGFDPRYRFLEDMELGHRLHQRGYRIRLMKSLHFTHCKRYTFFSLVRSDFWGRAIPWSRLILETGVVKSDLNLRTHNVASVPVSYLMLACLIPDFPVPLVLLFVAAFLVLNFRFFVFLENECGPVFALRAAVLCWIVYLYSGLGALIGIAQYAKSRWDQDLALREDLDP